MRKWSVGIIPFVKNEFTVGVYPHKINEYLAVGLPVVSARFSVIEGFDDVVNFIDHAKGLSKAIRNSAENDSASLRLKRNKFASHQTWQNRVELFSQCIEKVELNKLD